MVGTVEAELYVSTSAVDTDFITRLSDVHPNGYAQRMCQGISRLRYCEGYEKIKLVTSSKIVKISVDMFGTGQQFQAGDRIRLEITSSAFPSVAPNYNTDESMWKEKDPVVAIQTLYHSTERPLRLILSTVPSLEFSDAWTERRWAGDSANT